MIKNSAKMVKMSKKRKITEITASQEAKEVNEIPAKRSSDEAVPRKTNWINKQRVLVFASRGISFRDRHLMEDVKKLMPHHKTEPKLERSKTLSVINEICEIKNCTKTVLFEGRKKRDLYMWLSNIPNGPSTKFLVENIYTMAELKLTGNCLRGSRPLLSFDQSFGELPHWRLLKEVLTQIFGVPRHHPRSQPFFDHVYTFTVLDNRIWFRNFQILSEDGALAEVGPRFCLQPVKIFSGSFGGEALWENPEYHSPSVLRNQYKLAARNRYKNRQDQKQSAEARKPEVSYELTPLNDIFANNTEEAAKRLVDKEIEEKEDMRKKSPKQKLVIKKPKKNIDKKENGAFK